MSRRPNRRCFPRRSPARGCPHLDQRGAALIEFALIGPLFLMMLMGLIGYGGYFWRAHMVQQIANDAARAALAGLTANERATIARSLVTDAVAEEIGVPPARATVNVSEASEAIHVQIAYDASSEIFFHLGFVPMPDPVIRRRAAVRLGGL